MTTLFAIPYHISFYVWTVIYDFQWIDVLWLVMYAIVSILVVIHSHTEAYRLVLEFYKTFLNLFSCHLWSPQNAFEWIIFTFCFAFYFQTALFEILYLQRLHLWQCNSRDKTPLPLGRAVFLPYGSYIICMGSISVSWEFGLQAFYWKRETATCPSIDVYKSFQTIWWRQTII